MVVVDGITCDVVLKDVRVDKLLKVFHVQDVDHDAQGLVETGWINVSGFAADARLDAVPENQKPKLKFSVSKLQIFFLIGKVVLFH